MNGFTKLAVGAVLASAFLLPAAAGAYTPLACAPGCSIVVNATVDEPDADPGDGACATAAGDCTLRAAIQEANASYPKQREVLIPRGTYVLTRHGLDDDASHGDLDVHLFGQIVGAGQSRTVVDGDDADRVFDVHQGAEGSMSHLAIRHGRATDGPGGGIRSGTYPFYLSYVYVTNNEAVATEAAGSGNGGGIWATADLAVRYAQVAYNDAVNGAGMYWNGTQSGFGDDTFIGNHATGDGGGLYVLGGNDYIGNITLSANTAAGHGGGAYLTTPNGYGGNYITGSTIASNSAPHEMGGGVWLEPDRLTSEGPDRGLSGSIVARNGGGGDCAGPAKFDSGGGNLDGDGSCGFDKATDLSEVDPLLDDPAYNGSPVQTRALVDGSPAIDLWSTCDNEISLDARGVARPAGACDSGAFEVGDCCPAYEPPYVPTVPPPPPGPKVGDCGVIRVGTPGGDLLAGDRGHNQMYGRAGNDQIFGRAQSDCLYGGVGNDLIRGGSGSDLLVGFTGNDQLSGGDEEDVVRGGRGRDRILGGADEDRLFGGPQADYIKGGGGYDSIVAGGGDDTIDATGGGLDDVDCGAGFDRVRAKRHTHLSGCERVHYVD